MQTTWNISEDNLVLVRAVYGHLQLLVDKVFLTFPADHIDAFVVRFFDRRNHHHRLYFTTVRENFRWNGQTS